MKIIKNIKTALKAIEETRTIAGRIEKHMADQTAVRSPEQQEMELAQALSEIIDELFVITISAIKSGNSRASAKLGDLSNRCIATAGRAGLKLVAPYAGQPFDETLHSLEGEKEQKISGVIVETIKPGYVFREKLFRRATVKVLNQ